MAWWHKLIGKKSPAQSGEYKKIVAVHGETSPGIMKLDVGTFDKDGNPLNVPIYIVEILITPELRPTANRILAGIHTEEDEKVIELIVLEHLK